MGSSNLTWSSLKFCTIEDTLMSWPYVEICLASFWLRDHLWKFRSQLLIIFAIRINGLEAKMRTRFSAPFCISES